MNVAMTADVPPGPARKAGIGIVTLARLSGRPVVPVAVATSNFKTFETWSRFTFNLPSSRLAYTMGEPVWVARDASPEEQEEARLAIEQRLNEATRRAYEMVGRDMNETLPLQAGGTARRGLTLKLYRALSQGISETNAILPLIEALRKERPEIGILLTTVTVTSSRIAASRLPEGAIHQFIPLDSPAFVARFLDHWRPDMALFTESEIWPNLILEAKERGIPLALLNARMSDRSFRRWVKLPGLSRPLFSRFDLVLAQSERLAARLGKLGAPRVIAAGNLKFDAPPPPIDAAALAALRAAIGERPVFLAASLHPGEDEIVVETHRRLRGEFPGLLTIIVPRHPERGVGIASMASAMGFPVSLRSHGQPLTPQTQIYVSDTIGELGLYYSLAPFAFIGGSLVPHGGQNPIEAVKLGAAVISGPHWQNFREVYQALEAGGGCRFVTDQDDLAKTVRALLADREALASLRRNAETAIAERGGALRRTLEALEPFLPPRGGSPAGIAGAAHAP